MLQNFSGTPRKRKHAQLHRGGISRLDGRLFFGKKKPRRLAARGRSGTTSCSRNGSSSAGKRRLRSASASRTRRRSAPLSRSPQQSFPFPSRIQHGLPLDCCTEKSTSVNSYDVCTFKQVSSAILSFPSCPMRGLLLDCCAWGNYVYEHLRSVLLRVRKKKV